VQLTYLGTASVLIEVAGRRLLTDPAFDPQGTSYDFGPWYAPRSWFASEKTYTTPELSSGPIDAVLLSHDHHGDNLDIAGRRLLATDTVKKVVTTRAGARRLGRAKPHDGDTKPGEGLGIASKVVGLTPGQVTRIGEITVTATPARHGPLGTPQIHEVIGFLIEAPREPTVWISGDTVMYPALADCIKKLWKRQIGVAVMHAGGVRFPAVPVIGDQLFTFDAKQLVWAAKLLQPNVIIPVHRDGWSHFRESTDALKAKIDEAGLGEKTRWLALGETINLLS